MLKISFLLVSEFPVWFTKSEVAVMFVIVGFNVNHLLFLQILKNTTLSSSKRFWNGMERTLNGPLSLR
jgi:hypothetical protein